MEHWMTAQPRRVVLKGHKDAVNDARFSPDDIHITSASRDGSIRLWPVPVSSRVAELSESHCWPSAHQGQAVYAVRFSKDSSRIVSGGGDCHVRVWDLKSKKQLMELKCDGQILVVAVHQAPQLGEVFASGDLGGKISVWISRSSTGPPTLRWKSAAHTSRVRCIAFSPDGLRLASGSWDETAKIWDVLSGAELASMRHGGAVNGLAFVSNGAQLFTASACDDDREAPALYLWDANTGACVRKFGAFGAGDSAMLSLAFSENAYGSFAAFSSSSKQVRLCAWDADSSGLLRIRSELHLEGHEDEVRSVAFSADDKRIVCACDDNKILIWTQRDPLTDPEVQLGQSQFEQLQAAMKQAALLAASSGKEYKQLQKQAAQAEQWKGAAARLKEELSASKKMQQAAEQLAASAEQRAASAERRATTAEKRATQAKLAEESTVVELKATHAEAARLKRRLEMAEQSAQLLQGQLETAVQLSDAHLQTLSAAQLKELADRLHREARRVDETHVEKKCKEAAEAARRAAAAEVEDAKTCIVCSERSVEITLQPCGHSTLCEQCALLLWNSSRQCPVDRIAFTEYKRIRLPY